MARKYIDDLLAGRHDAVHVACMQCVSTSRQIPRVIQLLPLQPSAVADDGADGAKPLYDFSPSVRDILDELMPLAVKTLLFQAFLESSVSEQIMRMVAMKAATENAGDRARFLTRRFNRARQAKLTTGLMGIISGAATLD